ncbi:MAG TPA: MGMT family protein, partial [Pirellulales bacterium]
TAAQEWIDKKIKRSTRRSTKKPRIASRIAAALEGEPDDFRDVEIELEYTTTFGKRILQTCRKIGWGATQSYGQLAKAAGFPGAARAVGSVMAKNRTPIVVPCHRVIASGGKLGGYSASLGLTTKRRLLQLEAESAYST